MILSELYALSKKQLIQSAILEMRLPRMQVIALGMEDDELNAQSESMLIILALDWLEKRNENVYLKFHHNAPDDRRYLLDYNKGLSFGPDKLQTVLRAVLIVKEVSL